MIADDVAPSRLEAAQDAGQELRRGPARGPPGRARVTSTRSARVPSSRRRPTTDRLVAGIDSLQVGGGTATGGRHPGRRSPQIAAVPMAASGKPAPAAIVLMSDGSPTIGDRDRVGPRLGGRRRGRRPRPPASRSTRSRSARPTARQRPGPGRPGARTTPRRWRRSPSESGGKSFTAESADELKGVYDQIGRDVAYEEQPVDLTAAVHRYRFGRGAAGVLCCAVLEPARRLIAD